MTARHCAARSIDETPDGAASFIDQESLYSQQLGVAIAQTTYTTDEGSETASLWELLESADLAGVPVQADALHGNHLFSLPCRAGGRLPDRHQGQTPQRV